MKNCGASEEDKQRAKLAWEKYKKWMPESPDDERLYARLSRISAIMKMYGYKEGIKKIEAAIAQDVGIGTNGTC